MSDKPMSKAKQLHFKCKETGCDGVVNSTDHSLRNFFQVGGLRGVAVIACHRCMRLHFEDGSLVRNDKKQKAFLVKEHGTFEYRKLDAKEKSTLVRELISRKNSPIQKIEVEIIHVTFIQLVIQGHAGDCESSNPGGKCTCGQESAEELVPGHVAKWCPVSLKE